MERPGACGRPYPRAGTAHAPRAGGAAAGRLPRAGADAAAAQLEGGAEGCGIPGAGASVSRPCFYHRCLGRRIKSDRLIFRKLVGTLAHFSSTAAVHIGRKLKNISVWICPWEVRRLVFKCIGTKFLDTFVFCPIYLPDLTPHLRGIQCTWCLTELHEEDSNVSIKIKT